MTLLSSSSPKILVIGDLILDQYIYGVAERLSPEAPIPVVRFDSCEYRLGGAGNVAANAAALGANVTVIGAAGKDGDADILSLELEKYRCIDMSLYRSPDRQTTRKVRVIAGHQQVVRLDYETIAPLPKACEYEIAESSISWEFDAIIIADYAKGVISPFIFDLLARIGKERKIPIYLDPKVSHKEMYCDAHWAGTVMTPNLHEAYGLVGCSSKTDIEIVGRRLMERFGCAHVLITRGEFGMTLFASDGVGMNDLRATAQSVYDVSGAGDTVIATLAVMRARGYEMIQAAQMANLAAGIVVGKYGTSAVTLSELGLSTT